MKSISLLFILSLYFKVAHTQIPLEAASLEDASIDAYYFNSENLPKVYGKIHNLSAEEIKTLKIDYTLVTPFEYFQKTKRCTMNEDGAFNLELEHAFPYQQIWLSVGNLVYTSLLANKNLEIEIDASVIKSNNKKTYFIGPGLQFSGQDGSMNTYVNSHTNFRRNEQQEISQKIKRFLHGEPLEAAHFFKKLDSLYSELFAIDHEFIKENNSDFAWLIINQRQSKYYGDLCVSHWGQNMQGDLFDRVKNHEAYTISNESMNFYDYYFSYLIALVNRNRSENNLPEDTKAETLQTIQLLDSLHPQAKSDFLKMKFSSMDVEEKNTMLQTALSYMRTAWCKEALRKEHSITEEKIGKIQNILKESKPLHETQIGISIMEMPFGAKLYQVDTGSAKDLLSNLRSSFQDKALFIDFWATWCGPCIKEFPYSAKLKEGTKHHPIEFIYLCTSNSSSMEKWRSKIAEYKLSGTHVFVEEGIENELMDLFSLSGFPSYLLIDSKGNKKEGYIRPSIMSSESLIKLIEN